MKITSQKIDTSQLAPNDAALFRCQTALNLKDEGNYHGAQEVLRPLWKRVGDRPRVDDLHPSVAAEVLLCVGTLTCWIGGTNQNNEAQETAKNLITESVSYFESTGDVKKAAAARSELAFSYWYAGSLNEARIMFREALQILTTDGDKRARALFGCALVEWSASCYHDALKILRDNAELFSIINSHAHKAAYHNLLAMILREIAKVESNNQYLREAVSEYEQADLEAKLVGNISFCANIKNNVGILLRQLRRLNEAHKYIGEARHLAASIKDNVLMAQFDDSRALVLIEEKRFTEAAAVARSAVRIFEKTDRKCLLADALLTQGIALARSNQTEEAKFALQRSMKIASEADALNKAGVAALTLIEEVPDLSRQHLQAAFIKARRWLAEQSQDLLVRVNEAAEKTVLALGEEMSEETASETLLTTHVSLEKAVLKYEGSLIRQALAKANGRVTLAARLLGLSHQGLGYIMATRHQHLIKDRKPIRRRNRRIVRVE